MVQTNFNLESPNLGLSYLQASQTDKHVIVNEALQVLDILVGQVVRDTKRDDPPAAPNLGDAYVIGVSPSGVWANRARQLAIWRGDAWQFLVPNMGWRVRDSSTQLALKIFDGVAWRSPILDGASLTNIQAFGLGHAASPSTPFSAYLNQASWQALPVGEGGTGDIRIFARKAAQSGTASMVFQNGFSGRAETGLCSNDHYAIRVSPDGAVWRDAFSVDPATGVVRFPAADVNLYGLALGRGGGAIVSNTSFGEAALVANVTGAENSALGSFALASNTSGGQNTAVGRYALGSNTTGSANVAVGQIALFFNGTGTHNTAIGQAALYLNTSGNENTAVGHSSLASTTSGHQNTALGLFALYSNTTGQQNTAVGRYALSAGVSYNNCTGLGHNAQVTGSNQIQLGDSATTTYVFGAVQTRSDQRDKVDVRDSVHGLDFIRALRPVDYRWNYREDYIDVGALAAASGDAGSARLGAQPVAAREKARARFHTGLIAQDVQAVIDRLGHDFGGLQDHSRAGGEDVLTLGYDEFIAPIIKAIQELAERVDRLSPPVCPPV